MFLLKFIIIENSTPSNFFDKSQRLSGKKIVGEIFKEKSNVSVFPLKAFYCIKYSKTDAIARFGISVPKKKFKRAVDRNQIKRWVKEAIRLNKSNLNQTLLDQHLNYNIMIVCYFDEMPNYSEVEKKIIQLLERLQKRIQIDEKK